MSTLIAANRAPQIWDPDIECLCREELRALQRDRLAHQVQVAWDHLPYYSAMMRQAGVEPGAIRTLDDIQRLPFTTKEDLRETFPYKAFAKPLKDVVRLHASTGTTGKPTVVGYTRHDMEVWTELVARFLVAGGLREDDIVQIAFGYGLFTGGFGLHYGCERVGATVIPASSGNTERQIALMRDLGTTALVCTPTYAVYLSEVLRDMNIPGDEIRLDVGFFGGEFWSEAIRGKIQEGLGIMATDNYGLSEVTGPGVCGECLQRQGMHVAEDHFLIEIVDPETLEPLELGERGEVVITTLSKEANPVIRYRTRDISRLNPEPCACGRTMVRLDKVTGRTDDMLIIRGVNVFPSQIEHILLQFQDALPHYELVVSRKDSMDQLEVRVEVSSGLFSDEMKRLAGMQQDLHRRIERNLGIRVRLSLVEPGSIQRFTGKAKRIIDQRDGLS